MSYDLNRKCPKCGCRISDQNKTGYCYKHRPRDGKNNPMYGRSIKERMTEEEIEAWKKHIGESSVKKWKDPEYRNKVISSVTGKKRSEEFKRAQSERTKQSYINNPELRKQRGKIFSECWKDGRNHFYPKSNCHSKGENELFELILNSGQYELVERKVVQAANGNFYYPDILINEKYIIEYYGNYFHANPENYNENQIIGIKKLTVKEINNLDKKRQIALENAGYKFLAIWESEFKQNKELVLERINRFVNNN